MNLKKIFIIPVILTLFGLNTYAESLGPSILKKSDLSFDFPFALTAGELRNYSKADYGFELKLATELLDFSSKKITAGLCSTFFYNTYAFKREEIKTFYIRGFTEGIWIEYQLPKEFFLRTELNTGLGITKVNAESIYEAKIENNYNAFVIGINSAVTRKIYDAGYISFHAKGGIDIKFLKEESTTNTQIGLVAGLTLKAGKKWQ